MRKWNTKWKENIMLVIMLVGFYFLIHYWDDVKRFIRELFA